jgi:hypothetical protein
MTMTERWRKALDALGRAGPDERRIRALASGGPRMPDPESPRSRRVVAGTVGFAVAVASFAFVWSAFGDSPVTGAASPSSRAAAASPSTSEPTAVNPSVVCDVPQYDPEVALLVGQEEVEVPRQVLEQPGAAASSLSGPAADELRAYLASPAARNAPSDGWRLILETSDGVTYAAPPDGGYSDWWVVGFEPSGEGWRRTQEELVEQQQTHAQRGHGLRLAWASELVLQDGSWDSSLEVVNERSSAWVDDQATYWGLVHVFDRSTGRELGAELGSHAAVGMGNRSVAVPGAPGFNVAPGGHARLPVTLGGVGTSLDSGTYDVIACVPALGLASPVETLRIIDGPADAPDKILTYRDTGFYMTALMTGTLSIHNGCLAVETVPGDQRPVYVLWPDGFALVHRGGRTVLIDPVGREIGAPGDHVTLGGGGVSLDVAVRGTIGGLPESCRSDGGYWVTGGA